MITLLQPLIGMVVILGLAYVCSTNRRAIDFRTVAVGLALQFLFALVVLKTTAGAEVFTRLGNGFNRLVGFAGVGAAFYIQAVDNSAPRRMASSRDSRWISARAAS